MSEALVAIRLQPRASRDQVQGLRDGAIAIQLKAPPVDGEANAALLRFVARALSVRPSGVVLVRGQTSRLKWIQVEGFTAQDLQAQLLAMAQP